MKRISLKRPSPALVVAVVALVAALAGTAVAEVATTSKLDKKEKKQTKKIAKKQADKQITNREPDLNVASAETAQTANTASDADTVDGRQANELETNSAYAQSGTDNSLTTTDEEVISTTITTQATKRVTAQASVDANETVDEGVFICSVSIAGQDGLDYSTTISDHPSFGSQPGFVGPMFSRELGPGTHEVTVDCREAASSAITVTDVSVSVSALGA